MHKNEVFKLISVGFMICCEYLDLHGLGMSGLEDLIVNSELIENPWGGLSSSALEDPTPCFWISNLRRMNYGTVSH